MDATDQRPIDDGTVEIAGKTYMPDAKGNLVPLALVRPAIKLEDETVRKVLDYAEDLSAQIGRFFAHTLGDLGALDALLEQQYEVTRGGRKGNRTYTSFDGLKKVQVQVQVADRLDFGPELQAAKALIDECLVEWVADGRDEIRAIVLRAFNVEKEGKINQAELFMLLRLEIADARWRRAMQAIRDAIRIIGAKQYVRFYRRELPTSEWQAVTIDLAKV